MDEAKAKATFEEFWRMTDRKKGNTLNDKELKPDQFQNWGEITKIRERSTTLSELVKKFERNTPSVVDPIATFKTIMAELDLKFEVIPLKTFEPKHGEGPQKHAVVYQVQCLPRWSFRGLGTSHQEACRLAANNGIEFFVTMAIY